MTERGLTAEQEAKELAWLRKDALRMEQVNRDLQDEVRALQDLVGEIIDQVCPAIATFRYQPADKGWQRRAQRAAAHVWISTTEEDNQR